MAQQECTDFQFKQGSLKDILEELAKLYNAETTRKKVFQQLKSYLGAYCAEKYLDAFYQDLDYGRGVSYSGGTIQAVTYAGKCICEAILQSPTDGRSVDTHSKHEGQTCGEKYFNALKECLPKAYAALFFLFFNVSTDCKGIGGGKWNGLKVNGSGHSNYLFEWLTDQDGSDDFIARGYRYGELHGSNDGQKVADPLKKAVSLTPSSTEGSLQNVLCGLMFVCDWDDALTGHACAFLYKFCDEVGKDTGGKLKERLSEVQPTISFENLKRVCGQLKGKLDSLVNGTSGLRAVCQKNTGLFKDLWDDGKFGAYCTWLKDNLKYAIESLNRMSSNPNVWSAQSLEISHTPGPFKYGFVFHDSKWESVKGKAKDYISALTDGGKGSLKELEKCLKGESLKHTYHTQASDLESSSESPSGAAAAGGATAVLGIGGAGFGAAYGFNLFGLKDIMSGVFGAIRGLVVGF
ncbi:secreted antigen 3 [Babesia divergens]|uniref:Secreted antigen 3 n=1 Tax=Babesia divergens TaxID=32595 RepID=A0AAD9LDX6_BABDI|nr:secreted antigen 3 [Babesia divergens]